MVIMLRVSFSGSPVAWRYQKLSGATWIQELVVQLGYQPKVQNKGN